MVVLGCGLASHFAVSAAASDGLTAVPSASTAAAATADAIGDSTSDAAVTASLAALAQATTAAGTVKAKVAPLAVPAVPAAPAGQVLNTPAMARATQYIGTVGPWAHLCLSFVRTVFGLPMEQASAISAWNAAQYKHIGDFNPPAGVPVFWSGGTSGAGHVAFSMGNGWIVTTDYPVAGGVSEVPLSYISALWHLQYLGWTEDLEGSRVYTP
jgi:hypothetical protein